MDRLPPSSALRTTQNVLLGLLVVGALSCSGSKTIIDEDVSPDVPPAPECTQNDQCAHLTTNCGKGVCDEQTSECTVQLRPLGSACNVALECALGRCISGVCNPEIILSCNDNDPCTHDICDMDKGCLYLPMDGACDDNNPCTEGDACVAKACTGGNYICDECTDNAGCEQYDDQNACNGVLTCDTATNQCHIDPGSISTCISSNPCLSAVCNTATGLCEEHPRPNGSACSDNNLCSLEDRCTEGQCVGAPLHCPSSGKGCIVTACTPKSACVDTALHGQPCQDGNQCTNDDVCAEGHCAGTTVETCTCIQDTDCTLFDDANLCNGQVRCMGGHCLVDPTTIPTCEAPGIPCVSVQCVPESGVCTTTMTTGLCADGDLCTIDEACVDGVCIGEPTVCDDGNDCTTDSCETATGCQFEAIPGCANEPCEDGTSETCNGCGTRTCTGDVWGPCEGGIACDGKECGDDGCDGACGTCDEGDVCIDGQCTTVEECTGECALGETGSQGCGNCGSQTRSCSAQCTWGPWGDCEGQGACSPGATESSGCGNCGSSTRTCNDGCGWGGWSGCGDEGACSPGATESSGCGNCGSSTRSCNGNCSWDGWSNCGGEGPCSPGQSQGCGQCGSQSCNGDCQWDGCNDGGCYPGTQAIYRYFWYDDSGGSLTNANHMIRTVKSASGYDYKGQHYEYEGKHFELFVSGDGPDLVPLYQAYKDTKINHLPTTQSDGGTDLGYTGHTVIGYCSSKETAETPTHLIRVYANLLIDHFATTNPDAEIANGQGFYVEGGNLCWVP